MFALRLMRRSPVVTAVAVLSLALGIGANTAIFSILDSLLLRSLPVREPERLVLLGPGSWTNPLWEQIRDRRTLFDGALAWSPAISMACICTNGAAPVTPGVRSAMATTSGHSCMAPAPKIVACGTIARMRTRISRSKPFITASTSISSATPIARPAADTRDRKDTSGVWPLAVP